MHGVTRHIVDVLHFTVVLLDLMECMDLHSRLRPAISLHMLQTQVVLVSMRMDLVIGNLLSLHVYGLLLAGIDLLLTWPYQDITDANSRQLKICIAHYYLEPFAQLDIDVL